MSCPLFRGSTCLLNTSSADVRVGYETTVYTTPEGDVSVELCVVLYEPVLGGGAPRPFTLTYQTADGTARKSLLAQKPPFITPYIYDARFHACPCNTNNYHTYKCSRSMRNSMRQQSKAMQTNEYHPRLLLFPEKRQRAALGGIQTHDTLLSHVWLTSPLC